MALSILLFVSLAKTLPPFKQHQRHEMSQLVDDQGDDRQTRRKSSTRASGAYIGLTSVSSVYRRPSGTAGVAQPHFEAELEELRRYEDFTTIDWVQDAAKEQYQRADDIAEGQRSFYFKLLQRTFNWQVATRVQRLLDESQVWLVLTIVGVFVGINAACMNIMTEYLSDVKLGYCSTSWYLNSQFCCMESDVEPCSEWKPWSSFGIFSYLAYIFYAVSFASSCAFLVKSFAPYAAGSGISEIKVIIGGFIMSGYLGGLTLFVKSIGLPLAIASGLSVGKEGPSVHVAVCAGNVISRLFKKYDRHAAMRREMYSIAAAAGVAVAFGSPIGGVIFSLEEMAPEFPMKTIWRSFFCALIATFTLASMNPFRTGQLVLFQVHYDRDWHFFEILFFIIIGIFGGVYGSFVIKWNLRAQSFRKRYLGPYPITEVTVLCFMTAVVGYFNRFLRIDMTESMEILFRECEGANLRDELCRNRASLRVLISLLLATIIRTLFIIVTFGCKVPAGIFVPSMAVGASFGRFVGELVKILQTTHSDWSFFSGCKADEVCITPGAYAFLGAAATLSGIMHITLSVVVIMFEITGALRYILPTMIVVGVTKAVGDIFGKGGIADRSIVANGFPFLDTKGDHSFGVGVEQVMKRDISTIPSSGLSFGQLGMLYSLTDSSNLAESMLKTTSFEGYPIVEDQISQMLIGFIGRTDLQFAIEKLKRNRRVSQDIHCLFSTIEMSSQDDQPTSLFDRDVSSISFEHGSVDFAQYIQSTPITVHPDVPLDNVMEIFKKIGPRVILVGEGGKLMGLITVKDVLKYQRKAEYEERPRDNGRIEAIEQKIWNMFQKYGSIITGIGESLSERIKMILKTGMGRVEDQNVELGDR